MKAESSNVLAFGDFRLDLEERLLLRSDGTEIPVTPRIFQTLRFLVEHSGRVLDKELIMEAVWPDCVVEENNLAQNISTLRRIFGDTPGCQRYIATVPGRGYRFIAEVHAVSEMASGIIPRPDTALNKAPEAKAVAAVSVAGSRWHGVRVRVAAVAIIAFLTVGIFSLIHNARHVGVSTAAAISTQANIPEKSVAVLPFDNLSDQTENAYFAAGVQDEILSNLAKIADLKVISRTSANLYKSGNPRNSREIGRQLGVAHLLEGNVQRIGNRLRVNAQLIDTRADTHTWAQTYDRDVADLFAIQSEIAQAIAGQLYAKISPAERIAIERAPTADLTAFDLYTRAKNLSLGAPFASTKKNDLLQAADLLNQAIARDPAFFLAYCQLALTHDYLYFFVQDHTPGRLALAEVAIQGAFRLRPDAGEAHLARAEHLYRGYLDYDGALAELEVARERLPNDAHVFQLLGSIQRRRGHWEESIGNLEHAVDLDPRNIHWLQEIADTYGFLRRYGEAKSAYDRALTVAPDDIETKIARARVELDWKADSRPLHQTIDSIQATSYGATRDVALAWFICALAERDPTAAANAVAASGGNGLVDGPLQFSRKFLEGMVARITKDDEKARLALTAARGEQEKIVKEYPDYGPPLLVLGLIDASLGRKEEALREGRRAVELSPLSRDSIVGIGMIKYLAVIAAWAGDRELACEQLRFAARYPGPLSYGELKLLSFWDPLRGDPCFEQIVVSLAPKSN